MFYNLKILLAVLCLACIFCVISRRTRVLEEKSVFEFQDYCFYGTENLVPQKYSEGAVKRDILSKLPKDLKPEVDVNLRRTNVINEKQRKVGETACPFQVNVTQASFQFSHHTMVFAKKLCSDQSNS